jgi:hypothetical protein
MAEFEETVFRLKEDHSWRCKSGYKIFVLDRGALRFDVPSDWVMQLEEKSVRFYDRQPPDDNCRLEVSLLRHPQIDWSGLPLDQLLQSSTAVNADQESRRYDVQRESRPGLELVWVEKDFMDPQEGKPARSRIAIVRGANWHALITLDFWDADAGRVNPVWDEILRSVDAGLRVKDPTIGEQRM